LVDDSSYVETAETTAEQYDGWSYITHFDRFLYSKTNEMIKEQVFNNLKRRDMPDGANITPSKVALDIVKIPIYYLTLYKPDEGPEFLYNGQSCVNTYNDNLVPAMPAVLNAAAIRAVDRVNEHFYNLTRNQRDAEIVISWLRYIATRQRPNWAVVMQGPGGDGKTLVSQLMQAIIGPNNVGIVDASVLGSIFTDWAQGHQLAVIEEIYLPGHKWEVLNKIKQFISNDPIGIHPKNYPIYTAPNTQAYLALTNHRNALPVNDHDRRYFVTLSPFLDNEAVIEFQSAHPDYFHDYIAALKQAGALRKWLLDYTPHPDFDPKGRAPWSAGRDEMAALSESHEAEVLRELLTTGRRFDVSRELVLFDSFAEEVLDDPMSAKILGTPCKNALMAAGFTHLGRFSIDNKRDSIWSRTPKLFGFENSRSDRILVGRRILNYLKKAKTEL